MSLYAAIASRSNELAYLYATDPTIKAALRRAALGVGQWARHARADVALARVDSRVRSDRAYALSLTRGGSPPAWQNLLADREATAARWIREDAGAIGALASIAEWLLRIDAERKLSCKTDSIRKDEIKVCWSAQGHVLVELAPQPELAAA